MAAAADDEERDENDPDPVVVKERAKATGVASTVRVHKNLLFISYTYFVENIAILTIII